MQCHGPGSNSTSENRRDQSLEQLDPVRVSVRFTRQEGVLDFILYLSGAVPGSFSVSFGQLRIPFQSDRRREFSSCRKANAEAEVA